MVQYNIVLFTIGQYGLDIEEKMPLFDPQFGSFLSMDHRLS